MEDDLNFRKWKTTSISGNGRRPQFFRKWKTTSIFQEIEDKLNFSGIGRRPQFFTKWKTPSNSHEKEDDLSFQKMADHLNIISSDTKYF
jgi:hypothetical protein